MKSFRNRVAVPGFSQMNPMRKRRKSAVVGTDPWSDPMPDEMYGAERLAAALEGATGVDGHTRALTWMAADVRSALAVGQLDPAARLRIYERSMRLVEHPADAGRLAQPQSLEAQARRALGRVPVGRRGGVVLGGVAAASVAAAIGYAVVHDRRRRGSSVLAGL